MLYNSYSKGEEALQSAIKKFECIEANIANLIFIFFLSFLGGAIFGMIVAMIGFCMGNYEFAWYGGWGVAIGFPFLNTLRWASHPEMWLKP